MTGRVPADQAVRERLRRDFDTTFFVEAGAGTGKTSEIVARIVALVAADRLEIRALAAITFTVAAAAELRARVREGLEQAGRDERRSAGERERCVQAARGIDEAAIDTIHAFAGALLRTFPLEAGLPPGFETLDEIQQELEFEEGFRAWFAAVQGDPLQRELIRRGLLLGITPQDVTTVARGLHGNYDLLRTPTASTTVPANDLVPVVARLGEQLANLENRLRPEMTREPIALAIHGLQFAAERLRAARSDDDTIRALRAVEDIPAKNKGTQTIWDKQFGKGSGALLKVLKDGLKAIEASAAEALHRRRRELFLALKDVLTVEVLRWSAERRRRGIATFQDLLTWSRDLLRTNAEVRARAQRRWTRIFIDEFQDTDPLQVELAFYLAAVPETDTSGDWRDFSLVPGKLFLVGDPKQSIYRFRRADIGLYERVRDGIAQGQGESLVLAQNFRSVPRIVDFVNAHYTEAMQPLPAVQPEYHPLAAEPEDTGDGVWRFGAALDVPQPEVWRAEADAVARSARTVVEGGWLVSDKNGAERTRRPARYADICILIPARTNLRRLERAFEREDVRYRIESGELIVATQEVRDVVSCLRAIDDPSDQVALVATLRSALYGCSDDELLQWVDGGGRLSYDYIADRAPAGRVRDSLTDLQRFHDGRNVGSVAALIERILTARTLVPAAFGQPRPREIWRRYRYLVDRARAFAETGRTSLRSFVDWIEGIEREQVRGVSPAVAETDEDAVRLLTVHGAKGLEFPVVILTGWCSKPSARPQPVIADRVTDTLEFGLGPGKDKVWATEGYADASRREKELGVAEEIRLSYVASTRARDHLVVSLFRGQRGDVQGDAFAKSFEAFEAAPVAFTEPSLRGEQTPATDPRSPEENEAEERAWIDGREAVIEARTGLKLQTATGLAHESDEGPEHPEDSVPPRRGRGATSLGRAVHAVLQTIDLATLADLDVHARAQAQAEGVGERAAEIAALVRTTAELEPVRHAVMRGRYWREVPVGGPIEGGILEGVVDLLYEDGRGDLVVLDYKTDAITASELDARLERYRPQGRAYATLVEAATKRRVVSVIFAFARLGLWRAIEPVSSSAASPPDSG